MQIALIRHGDYFQRPGTPSAHQPYSLNAAGERQAAAGAERVKTLMAQLGLSLDPIAHSSSLLRAWQTATLFKRALPELTGIDSFGELAERGLGSAANLTLEQIASVMEQDPRYDTPPADWKSNSHYRLPLLGAESLMDAGQRVADHLRQMKPSKGLKLIFGHGAAFRHGAHLLGVLRFEEIARLSMYHGEPVILSRSPAGHWSHIGGRWKPRKQNEILLD